MADNQIIEIDENEKQIIRKNLNLKIIKLSKNSQIIADKIKNFNASQNQIISMKGISNFFNLIVLNLSHNQIQQIEGLQNLKNLCALILNNNKISQIQGLENCLDLNTIVLSNNLLKDLSGITHLQKLKKLSVSHNQIENLVACTSQNLEELRVNDNKIIEIPNTFNTLTKLKIFDIGKNNLIDSEQILILKDLKLINLNILGNPCSEKALQIAIKFPRLRFINNVAAQQVLENHKSKIPIKILQKTEKIVQKLPKNMVPYDLEKINKPIIQQQKKSQILKIEKNKNIIKKQQTRVKKIIEQNNIIEKW